MNLKFIPLDYDYFDWKGKNYIRIFGRTSQNEKICIIDSYEPNFWAILKQNTSDKKIQKIKQKIEKIQVERAGRKTKVLKTEIHDKNFLGKKHKAIKIFVENYKDSHAVADELDFSEIYARREYDMRLITKYIMDKNILPLKWHNVNIEKLDSEDFGYLSECLDLNCYKLNSFKKLKQKEQKNLKFKPKILAFDIETSKFEIGKGDILMISLYGKTSDKHNKEKEFKKVLTWKSADSKNPDFVQSFPSERQMLKQFVKYVKDYDPDFLVGYFSDGFDLPYLRAAAENNNIKLDIGLDNSQPIFSKGRLSKGKITGIIHIDIYRFIESVYSQYLQSETLGLNDIASELLGEKKHDFDFSKLEYLDKNDWKDFFKYNLQDSKLTYLLFKKTWPDIQEFTNIIQEPIFRITRNSMSAHVEDYILHNLHLYNEIAEKRPLHDEIGKRRAKGKYEGAFVFQPLPGLYENIGMFDFTSMYASVIVSYNLSLSTLIENKSTLKNKDIIKVNLDKEGNVYFSKKQGFFPKMLKEIINLRKQYKRQYNKNKNPITKARSNAYKLLANAAYGYQGYFGARYYCREAAASTAKLAKENILNAIENIKKQGYEIIYSDSIDGKTKIFIRKKGNVYEEEIEKIFERIDKKTGLGKEYNFKKNIEVLTIDKEGNSVFKPIVYVMRHKCNKKIYRVWFTNHWYIDVTEDHSLIGYQSTKHNQSNEKKQNPIKRLIEIKPGEVKEKANSIITLKKINCENSKEKKYPKEIYEFLGYFIGDGSFMPNKYGKNYYLRISAGKDTKELKNKLITPLQKKGYIKNIWEREKGDIVVNGLKLVNLVFNNCRKSKKKIIPRWLFYEKEENIASFLRGLFSANGCVMLRGGAPIIKYTSVREDYIKEARKLLYRIGISHSVFKENTKNTYKTKDRIYSSDSYSKNIIVKNKEAFAEKIGFLLERKNKRAQVTSKSLKKSIVNQFEFDIQNVKNIEKIKTPNYIYDIEVRDNHRFFANYVLVHNTDSIAFLLNNKTQKQTLEFLNKLNSKLPGIMELELEDFYKRGLFVSKRTVSTGAKKKYALIDYNKQLKVRGFETVRRDWCNLARELQNKVLELILKNGNEKSALKYLKKTIKKVKNKNIEKKQLIIKTQLKKPLSEYIAKGPHVIAALKMEEQGIGAEQGDLIEYYVAETKNGKSKTKQLVRERVKLPNEKGRYDISYYLNNQIKPAVENIFKVFNVNVEEIIEEIVQGSRQKKLF